MVATWWSVGIGAAAVVVLRLVLSADARFPRVVADEPAYLAMGRLLGGGERWDLGLASTYGPAYSVLLAPWFALGLSPDAVYRAAIGTNVALAGLTFLVLEALARRLPGVRRPLSAGLAAVATSLPGLVATTTLAWSDTLAPLTFAVLVLVLVWLVDRPGRASVVGMAAVSVAGYAVHGRFLPLVPIVLVVLVVLAVGGRLPAPVAALGGVGTVVGLGLVHLASEAIYDRLYDPAQVTQGLNEADRITHVRPLVVSVLGQTWTLVTTTGGMAGLGVVALVLAVARGWRTETVGGEGGGERSGRLRAAMVRLARPAGPDGDLPPLVTATVLALVALAFLVSVVFMTDRPRGDHLVYGRYNDLFVAPLVLWGGALLAGSGSRLRTTVSAGAVAAVGVGTAIVLWRVRRGTLEGGYLVFPVLGIVAVDHAGPAALPQVTVVGIAILLVLAVLALALPLRPRGVALVAISAVLCVVGAVRAVDRTDPARDADPRDAATMAEVLEDGERLVWLAGDADNPISKAFYRDQLYTPDNPSVRVGGEPWATGAPFVVAGARRAGPGAAGYRLAWVDPVSTVGLWVGPGDRQDALAADGALLPPEGLAVGAGEDAGSVRFVGDPTLDDGRVTATLAVALTGGVPWPTAGPGVDPSGRIRIGITVEGERCGCVLLDGRADVGRWVDGDEERLTVDVDVAASVPDGEEATVTAQLLREGVARFGRPSTAALD